MKYLLNLLFALILAKTSIFAQSGDGKNDQNQIIALEKAFAEAIKIRDTSLARKMQAESYFLAVAIKGEPLHIIPRSRWLANLVNYVVESYSIDDVKVSIYGNTAVVLMLFTQKATSGGQDRSAQFLLTDIWIRQGEGWVIAERHSSRPEVPVSR